MIYENIKSIANEQCLTIKQIEISAGLSNGTISKWRVSIPTSISLSKVADVLGVTMEVLLKNEVNSHA